MAAAQYMNYPEVPGKMPETGSFTRLVSRLLPSVLRPRYRLDALFACNAQEFADNVPEREDISLTMCKSAEEITPGISAFMKRHTSRLVWGLWKKRLRNSHCRLMLARDGAEFTHYTFVNLEGRPLLTYADVLPQGAVIIGPCYTAPGHRGKGIHPYVVSRALLEIRDSGHSWSYRHIRTANESLVSRVGKIPHWKYVGEFLFYRKCCGRYTMIAASVEDITQTRRHIDGKKNEL